MEQIVELSKYFAGKPHWSYLFPVDFSVVFTNREKNIRKQIIGEDGTISDFPGVEDSQALRRELGDREYAPVVKYEVRFERIDGCSVLMVWTVRPDGAYWSDDWGFGEEDYEAVELASRIDENGDFTGPFRLYRVGDRKAAEGRS